MAQSYVALQNQLHCMLVARYFWQPTESSMASWSTGSQPLTCVSQGIASAPLWDAGTATVPGMVSASDFIQVLHPL
jgi:hypothetical protein